MAIAGGSRAAKNPKSCHDRALGLLAVRMRSRRELRDRLMRAGFDQAEVADELDRLTRVGLLDDDRFAEEYARHASDVKRSGRRAIASALLSKGVGRETVDRVLEEAEEGEQARAEDLARARAARMRGVPPATAYQRLASLLMRRGYEPSLARRTARLALDLDGVEE
jgi:regulatory protein